MPGATRGGAGASESGSESDRRAAGGAIASRCAPAHILSPIPDTGASRQVRGVCRAVATSEQSISAQRPRRSRRPDEWADSGESRKNASRRGDGSTRVAAESERAVPRGRRNRPRDRMRCTTRVQGFATVAEMQVGADLNLKRTPTEGGCHIAASDQVNGRVPAKVAEMQVGKPGCGTEGDHV